MLGTGWGYCAVPERLGKRGFFYRPLCQRQNLQSPRHHRLYSEGAHHVEITVHADAIHIGSLFGHSISVVEPLAKAIDAGGIPCITTDNIEKDLWAKMLYNCALNPLGAILDVPYGALADSPDTRQIMNTIITEIYSVMNAAGYSTHWETARQYQDIFYNQLVPPTAEHYSSTLQDLKAGRNGNKGLTGQISNWPEKNRLSVPYRLDYSTMQHSVAIRSFSLPLR
jgi:2-dehydropantoate 2-reductase